MLFAKSFGAFFFDVVELNPNSWKGQDLLYTIFFEKVKIFEKKIAQFFSWMFDSLHPLKGPQGPLTTPLTGQTTWLQRCNFTWSAPKRHGDKHVTRVLVIENNY